MPPTARERSGSREPGSRGRRGLPSFTPCRGWDAPERPITRRTQPRLRLSLTGGGASSCLDAAASAWPPGAPAGAGDAGSPWAGGPGEEMCRTTATLADGRPAAMAPGPAGRVAPAVCRPPLAPRSREPLDARGSAIHIPGGATRTRPTATSTSGLPRGPDGADRSGRRRDRAWMLGGRRVPRPSWHGTSPGRAARGQAARLDAPQVPGM